MSRPPNDDELRGLFREARRADEEAAPPFRRVLQRRPTLRFAGSGWIGRAFAVAAAVVLAIAAVTLRRSPEIPADRIETWKPPTDFLREGAFTELFDTTPTLPEPVPDYSLLLANEKGDKS